MAQAGGARDEFLEMLNQVPEDWKKPLAGLIATAGSMWTQLKSYENKLNNIAKIEEFVNSSKGNHTVGKANTLFDQCKNVGATIRTKILEFCAGNKTCEDFETVWEEAKKDILDKLKDEKTAAANTWVKSQAIISAVVILIEFHAIYSVWQDVQNAENIIKQCKERDIPAIQARISALQKNAIKLKTSIESYVANNTQELKQAMQAIAFSLILEMNSTRNMIESVKYNVKNQIICIGKSRDDQFRRGISNTAHAVGNGLQLLTLAENLSNPYFYLQASIVGAFGALAIVNGTCYYLTGEKLDELRATLITVCDLERFVQDTQLLIEQAQSLYLIEV